MDSLDILLESLMDSIDEPDYENMTAMEAFGFGKNKMNSDDKAKCEKILEEIKSFSDTIYSSLGEVAERYIGYHAQNLDETKYIKVAHNLTKKVHSFCNKKGDELSKIPGKCFAKWRAISMISALRRDFPLSNLNVEPTTK